MQVLLTQRFEKKFYKALQNHFSIEDFSHFLLSKTHTLILLHSPFQKFKGKVGNSEIRGVAVVMKNSIIPLTLFLKKDKNFGENVSWKSQENLIVAEYDFTTRDIQEGNYSTY